jgi:hypothetical protein
MPARSFRIIRSAFSACSGALATSNPVSERLPVFETSLWQTWQ